MTPGSTPARRGLLDEGREVEWAETFTETAAFRGASRPQEALVGRQVADRTLRRDGTAFTATPSITA
ncbi:hypothetical protein [Streptomyces caniscabiei]|uniref:Uncharacterized protein n=1 Tax=Streptomyces caniscabiei TaxID=2746961 RepID=A0A927LCE9_9ACTN|nr:hypothetical protein [Streptomyces caniscabiei]MBD9703012.1 hypothetical protein [Streptomyces caniscabiei]MBD9729199.1 hypothetical protein [Streptomyces caniscabiei]MDX3514961.1 hypothetical protein [Streptomyces caniscabiei]MDX3724214.1 hypothetical protein [Streptomyces caniscabiei]MDX3732167.1 hypothetical protein [Streptomyces caniscabiei]